MISGVYSPDEGEIFINGDKISFPSPMDARNGHRNYLPRPSISNKHEFCRQHFLGREITRKFVGFIPVLNRKCREAKSILNELDIEIHGLTRPTVNCLAVNVKLSPSPDQYIGMQNF